MRSDSASPLLSVEDLSVWFPFRGQGLVPRRQFVHALDSVSLTVGQGETVALVGESGSGKTTLGYAVLGHHKPRSGRVMFDGVEMSALDRKQLRRARRNVQMIFQDPYSSLNPRMKVGETIGEPLLVHGLLKGRAAIRQRVGELLELCGLSPAVADRYPHAFSGGQRQRVVIARALALSPKLIVADEPTSALDVSVQAQVVNLLQDLQSELGLSYLFISHDLAVVRHLAKRIVILYAGKAVESGDVDQIFNDPLHPYTRNLLAAIPVPETDGQWHAKWTPASGEVASVIDPPPGCRFAPRCERAMDRCRIEQPPIEEKHPGHFAACWDVPIEVGRVAPTAPALDRPTVHT
jgi:oligopeptide/dipeptide ABC transporter ATP-binding protein